MKSFAFAFLVIVTNFPVTAFGPTVPATLRPSSTRLGISEALGRYIDEEYYRETHKDEYNAQWMHHNKAAIVYHTRDGELVMRDPHVDFSTPHHVTEPETTQHYLQTHPQVLCSVKRRIMKLRPHEFMRECHNCCNRCTCTPAQEYYNEFLAALKPKRDTIIAAAAYPMMV